MGRYLALTYVLLLVNSLGLLRGMEVHAATAVLFIVAVHVSYCTMYAFVAIAPALVLNEALRTRAVARSRGARWAVLGLALVSGSVVQLGLFADGVIFDMYGFHLNGFVWNLVSTPGGIDSMGATDSTNTSIALLVVGFITVQSLLLAAALRSANLRRFCARVFRTRGVVTALVALVALAAGERIAYGVASFRAYRPILDAAGSVPFYTRSRMRRFCLDLGLEEVRRESVQFALGSGRLDYPRTPLVRAPDARNLNVVWLVAESWRGDTLTPELMPETTAFAERSQWFQNHYSAGNGTRMGMFGMFYGLYGPYWFKFLEANRGPVVIDTLLDAGYDIDVRTSARFTYPEFDRTLWARLPQTRMHEENPDLRGWENDREHVTALIDSIENRDTEKPFMRFMFFESAHAPYDFPKEMAVRRPFKRRLNYVTMDMDKDVEPIRNSYLNACHSLDARFGRVLTYLEESGLLDTTIVVVTGDHGEEFMEKGHWGHNSTFVDEQTRPPLVIWMPGREPRKFQTLSSHIDLPATILAALGVTTPPSEYSLGYDLFGDHVRDHVVVADWKRLAIVDEDCKIVAPVRDAALGGGYVTTHDDAAVPNATPVYAGHRDQILSVLRELARFSR